ncbi:hypothetical protein N7466_006070 [Penicillium verhagenii]|uniref:uncharacterized protein n=1 Tax=Penicillium verhagenii TaxID=1562060 RepID=UPI002545B731|nr:uncharacterized protein N7466_006070 [Penicillium verhagenii]KAJ5930577.1 hypothetical protein N7466_006070 [Penicillium verhagenii]
MNSEAWIPDFVVAVDFGMTCTGVAYSYAPDWPSPKALQQWPGIGKTNLANKVPSQLIYHPDSSVVRSWGFQCIAERDAPEVDIKQDFKLNLDPQFNDTRPDVPTCHDAMRWFQDYILCIYRYAVTHLARGFPRFMSRRVEFIFSVPTTWKDPRMVARLRESVILNSPMHRATIGLTEAEAAAVYASGHHYQKDDVILICDAGGGTMDVNILKLLSVPGEPTVFAPLGLVEGEASGSVMIDIGAHQLLCDKLEQISTVLPLPARELARQTLENGFEDYKCSFGAAGSKAEPLLLAIPGLDEGSSFPGIGIEKGLIAFSQEELKGLFDLRVKEMQGLLDEQIRRLKRSHPFEKISFIVLSGGFGSSPYIRKSLCDRYEDAYAITNAMHVLTVDEPQLAVVHGQVMNRIHQLKQGSHTLQSLFSRVSYGVICDQPYDPNRHTGESVRRDKLDKRMYAVQQIDWMVRQVCLRYSPTHYTDVHSKPNQTPLHFHLHFKSHASTKLTHHCEKQGDPVPREGVTQVFRRKIYAHEMNKPWLAQIVMSTLAKDKLPQSMSRTGADLICNIKVDMSSVDRTAKNSRWYHLKEKYYEAVINLKVIVGPTDLQFELWNVNGGRIRGETHDPVSVVWEPVQEKMEDVREDERKREKPPTELVGWEPSPAELVA